MRTRESLRLLFTVGLAVSLATVAGCASLPSDRRGYREDAPYKSVRLVGKTPSGAQYLGRVQGVAPREDFVEAAHDARVDIKTRAAWLGADVVTIDRVKVPASGSGTGGTVGGKKQVILTGRAFRSAKLRKHLGRRTPRVVVAAPR